jgi:hypothetical protein
MPDLTAREAALHKIKTGDIFRADGNQSGPLICLTTSVTETTIHARTVTHGLEFTFDRRTGVGTEPKYSIDGTITSVAPVPPDIYDALISLDFKRDNWDGPLSKEQKRALLFIADFYPENPIG